MYIYLRLYLDFVDALFQGSAISDFYAIRQELGVAIQRDVVQPGPPVSAIYNLHAQPSTKVPDITDMPRTLTALYTIATDSGMTNKTIEGHITFLDKLLDDFADLDDTGTNLAMRERITMLHLRATSLHERIQEVKENVQSMVQMVYLNGLRFRPQLT
jgi:hypothetical protein